MAKIAPCPFCGKWNSDDGKGECGELVTKYAVYCMDCGASGPCGDTPTDAIERWNRRSGEMHTTSLSTLGGHRHASGPTCRWCGQQLVLESAQRQGGPLNDSVAVCSNCKREQS